MTLTPRRGVIIMGVKLNIHITNISPLWPTLFLMDDNIDIPLALSRLETRIRFGFFNFQPRLFPFSVFFPWMVQTQEKSVILA